MVKKKKKAGFIFIPEFSYRQHTHLLPALGSGVVEGSIFTTLPLMYMSEVKGLDVGTTKRDTVLVQK